MAKRLRSQIWVDRQIQGALAMRVGLHWCLFAFISGVLTLTMQYIANPFASFGEQLSQIWRNQGVFLVVIVLLLPVFVYDTVKLSNRFAGPILRLRRQLRGIAAGQAPVKLKFRGNDFWRGLAEDFNRLVEDGHIRRPVDQSGGDERQAPEQAAAGR